MNKSKLFLSLSILTMAFGSMNAGFSIPSTFAAKQAFYAAQRFSAQKNVPSMKNGPVVAGFEGVLLQDNPLKKNGLQELVEAAKTSRERLKDLEFNARVAKVAGLTGAAIYAADKANTQQASEDTTLNRIKSGLSDVAGQSMNGIKSVWNIKSLPYFGENRVTAHTGKALTVTALVAAGLVYKYGLVGKAVKYVKGQFGKAADEVPADTGIDTTSTPSAAPVTPAASAASVAGTTAQVEKTPVEDTRCAGCKQSGQRCKPSHSDRRK